MTVKELLIDTRVAEPKLFDSAPAQTIKKFPAQEPAPAPT